MIIRRDVALKILQAVAPAPANFRAKFSTKMLAKSLIVNIKDLMTDPDWATTIPDADIADIIDDMVLSMVAGDSIEISEDGLPIQADRGVGATIVQMLAAASPQSPITIDAIIERLGVLFPERPQNINRAVVYENVPARLRRRGLAICSDTIGYWLAPGWKSGVFRKNHPWANRT